MEKFIPISLKIPSSKYINNAKHYLKHKYKKSRNNCYNPQFARTDNSLCSLEFKVKNALSIKPVKIKKKQYKLAKFNIY